MLAVMERPTVATLRALADVYGLPWTDTELEAALPAVTNALTLLASLETAAVDAIEPTTHFRVV